MAAIKRPRQYSLWRWGKVELEPAEGQVELSSIACLHRAASMEPKEVQSVRSYVYVYAYGPKTDQAFLHFFASGYLGGGVGEV